MAFLDETGLAELWGLICDKHDGFVNEYVWAKFEESQIDVIAKGESVRKNIPCDASYNISAYKTANVVNGEIVFSDSETVSYLSVSNYYAYTDDGEQCIIVGRNSVNSESLDCTVCLLSVSTATKRSLIEYVNSPDPSAYPVSDGYVYELRGRVGGAAQVVTGSYTGTGAHGSANPCSLKLGFKPKFFALFDETGALFNCTIYNTNITNISTQLTLADGDAIGSEYNAYNKPIFLAGGFSRFGQSANFSVYNQYKFVDDTLYWYNAAVELAEANVTALGSNNWVTKINNGWSPQTVQFNVAGIIYRYIAIG